MARVVAVAILVLIGLGARPATAIDHKNLDEGRPLRLDDAYSIATGEIAVEAGGGFTLQRRGSTRGFFAVEAKGIVTKSVERLSVHLNAGYEFLTSNRDEERDGRYKLALGASYPVGAPKFTRATIVGDVFAEQPVASREPTVVGTEVGLRYQLTSRIVWDVGVGTEFAGPAHRSTFFMTTGFSFGF